MMSTENQGVIQDDGFVNQQNDVTNDSSIGIGIADSLNNNSDNSATDSNNDNSDNSVADSFNDSSDNSLDVAVDNVAN